MGGRCTAPAKEPHEEPQPVEEPVIQKTSWRNVEATIMINHAEEDYYDMCKVPKVEIGTICSRCHKTTSLEKAMCRVCAKAYHPHCLEAMFVEPEDKDNAMRATSDIGWTCVSCANIGKLLTDEQIFQLNDEFDRYEVNRGVAISEQGFMDFVRSVHRQTHGTAMTPAEEQAERALFHMMDIDDNREISYWEFLSYHSCKIIQKNSVRELVKMLTPFEVWHAREVYDVRFNTDYMLDKHTPEYEFPFRGWYEHMEKIRQARKDSMRWQETTRNRVAIPNESVEPWVEYLEAQAMRIISSRPNYK
ncbi:hypothetical protein LSAT2_016848 [Lamellibrachia satsuma]|nr:hypothetical protein LSAT2_016848 [Lamellibrachia satsuma]